MAAEIETTRNAIAKEYGIETDSKFEFEPRRCGRDKASRWRRPCTKSGPFAPFSDGARGRGNGRRELVSAEKKVAGTTTRRSHLAVEQGSSPPGSERR